jgi:hypothetical protein
VGECGRGREIQWAGELQPPRVDDQLVAGAVLQLQGAAQEGVTAGQLE